MAINDRVSIKKGTSDNIIMGIMNIFCLDNVIECTSMSKYRYFKDKSVFADRKQQKNAYSLHSKWYLMT